MRTKYLIWIFVFLIIIGIIVYAVINGDCDGNGILETPDLTCITYIIAGETVVCNPVPDCSNMDMNSDGIINLTDKDLLIYGIIANYPVFHTIDIESNESEVLSNRTVFQNTDINTTFKVWYTDASELINVSIFFYNQSGNFFITQYNFTNVLNDTFYYALYNSSNFTTRDTITIQYRLWNGTYEYFYNWTSFVNNSNDLICADDWRCGFTNLEDCLITINNTKYLQCVIDEQGIYQISRSQYNISGKTSDIDSDYLGAVKIIQSNVTVDFNGTRIDLYNESNGIEKAVWTKREKFNTSNITIKSLNAISFPTAIQNSFSGWNGTSNFSVYNSIGTIVVAGEFITLINNSGGISKSGGTNVGLWNWTIINHSWGSIYFKEGHEGIGWLQNFNGSSVDISHAEGRGGNVTIINMTITPGSTLPDFLFAKGDVYNSSFGRVKIGTYVSLNNVTIHNTENDCLYYNTDNPGEGVVVRDSVLNCTGYGSTYGSSLWLGQNTTLINNYITTNNGSQTYQPNCLYLNQYSQNVHVINNTFDKCGYGNSTLINDEKYQISNATFFYNGIHYNKIIIANGGGTTQAVYKDYTNATDPDGVVHYELWLITDTLNAVGLGNNAKITAWIADDYPVGDCDTVLPTLGGTCDLNITYGYEAKGYSNNYTFNTTILSTSYAHGYPTLDCNQNGINDDLVTDCAKLQFKNLSYSKYTQYSHAIYLSDITGVSNNVNITGNTFTGNQTINGLYSIKTNPTSNNINLWYNNFYNGGIENPALESGCYKGVGNYYKENINSFASGECGLVNITFANNINLTLTPSPTINTSMFNINFTNQTYIYKNNITYYYEIWNGLVWNKLGTTKNNSFTIDLISYSNSIYTLNIIPISDYVGINGTFRNITFTLNAPITPNPGGGGHRPNPPENPPEIPSVTPVSPTGTTEPSNQITAQTIDGGKIKLTLEDVGLKRLKPKLDISLVINKIEGIPSLFKMFNWKIIILTLILFSIIVIGILSFINKYYKIRI